ncbi:Histone deacetylase HOS3 [Hyphodiscus hymeniophilus]|uniref:Histone deacetylase HOS3 n=1 Tax=Hyphodiscus hymeniophilus TaxID=353542 RepID=A0A9P6VSZ7_9HELO|nr:Histone deacetylase HOS3 [Hyphodiscus hymeniophilus]
MAHLSQNGVSEESIPTPSSPSTNKVAHTIRRLSTHAAASATSSAYSSSSPSRTQLQRKSSSSSLSGKTPQRSPLHRSPSSMSLDARSSTPTLLRKASMNSLHGVGGVTPSRDRTPSRASLSRRSSSASFVNGSTLVGKSPLSEIEDILETLPRHTAESVASNHFKIELDSHNKEDRETADTIVILHDSCYGHRYSRPRTSKASLSTIVERPERIHASILGVSVAYVRLGDRHAEGKYPLHPAKDPAAIPDIPFRIRKTTRHLPLTAQAVTNVHGVKWMEELKLMCDNAEQRLALNGKELTRPDITRSPEQGVPAKLHEGDLYLCSESLTAMEGALGAVCEGVDAVFNGAATGKGPHRTFVAIRPPGHHCSASYPSGFCWLNNVHVGIAHAALAHGLTHTAIIDFDLHHGDGSQAIAWEHNNRATSLPKNALPWKKTPIGYFSLHDINSYPCEQGDEEKVKNASLCIENAHGQSIWNVHLQPWKSESEFWELYENKYSVLLEKTRNFLRMQTERLRTLPNGPKPKAAIFISAGFDASEWESSGMQRHKVNVPTEFYARLTRDVVRLAAEEGTGVDGRIISVLEGGYSNRALCTGVFSHLSGLAGGNPTAINKELSPTGLGYEISQKIGSLSAVDNSKPEPTTPWTQCYDAQWWSSPQLEKLDATVSPPPPPEPKKVREGQNPTYSSPTQSFIAKVNSPRTQRSVSNISTNGMGSRPVMRAPSPPPPEVDWTVAAHELSKLLIPSDRQTMSCKPEELSAEATRARRDRQSIITPPTSAVTSDAGESSGPRMALRIRKPAKPLIESVEEDEPKKPIASKGGRRKTVAGPAILAAEKAVSRTTTPKPELPSYTQATQQSQRRLSIASTTGSVISEAPSTRPVGKVRAPPNQARPGSSQSIRPGSSMSSRGHSIPPVVVKKTRAPAQPRTEPAKPRNRRKSPLNDTVKVIGGNDGAMDPPSRAGSASLATNELVKPEIPDMDGLTSGMKKINISFVTKAQKQAREQAKEAATTSKPPAKIGPTDPKTMKAMISGQDSPQKQQSSAAPEPLFSTIQIAPEIPDSQDSDTIPSTEVSNHETAPSTPQQLPPRLPIHLQEASQVPLPASSPIQSAQPVPSLRPAQSADVFIPYQPEGPPPNPVPQQEDLRWLPPNISTPSPMKRGNLPVFTSTSAIPFGINPNQPANPTAPPKQTQAPALENAKPYDPSIWEVPDTPMK